MANEINNSIDMNDLIELLSRLEVNFSNILGNYFDIFYNDIPMDVTLEYYTDSGELRTIQVPNRAKYFRYIQSGEGSPEGVKTGRVGTTYQDLTNGKFYIKRTAFELTEGWKELATVDDMNALITKQAGAPEGYNTAPKGTLYVDLDTGSLWIKKTDSGNTGWVEIFQTDFATIRLDNLNAQGIDKLRTSNMYITGEYQTGDILGYEQLEYMYHSTIDSSKYEVVGYPVISSTGSVTHLSDSEYILIPSTYFDFGDHPWKFEWAGVMNHQQESPSYMLGKPLSQNEEESDPTLSFLNVYRGANNSIYFNIVTTTSGASGIENNVTMVGTPTVNNNIISGFSESSYATLPNTFEPNSNIWEFNTYITTGSDVTTNQTIIGSSTEQYAPFKLEISGGKLILTVCPSDEQIAFSQVGSSSISESTSYYVKVSYNLSTYAVSFSENGINWEEVINVPNANIAYTGVLSLGVQYAGVIDSPFLGSIDLGQSSISIDGVVTWSGTIRTGVPVRSDSVHIDIDSSKEGKPFKAYINYEGSSTNRYTFGLSFDNGVTWTTRTTTLNGRTLVTHNNNLPFGYNYGYTETYKEALYLNYVKVYLDEGSGLKPKASFNKTGVDILSNGKSVEYVESITGSKIVNVAYRDRLVENYQIDGMSEYYTIDEVAREIYLPMGELYGMIFRRIKGDSVEYTSQLINDSGFITTDKVYCVIQGNTNNKGKLDLGLYTPPEVKSGNDKIFTENLIFGAGTSTLPLPENVTEITVEGVSGGCGGRCFDGYWVNTPTYWYYICGASGGYYKGTKTGSPAMPSGNYTVTVGNGGDGGPYNGMPGSGGSTSIKLGNTTYLNIVGGQKGGSLSAAGTGGYVSVASGFTQQARIDGRSGTSNNGGYKIRTDNSSGAITTYLTVPGLGSEDGAGGRSYGVYYVPFNHSKTGMAGKSGYLKVNYKYRVTTPGSVAGSGIMNYNVTAENPLVIILKDGTKEVITSVSSDVIKSTTPVGVYNKFVDSTGSELLKNKIHAQLVEPKTGVSVNDVWVKFTEPLEVYKCTNVTGNTYTWSPYNKVPILSYEVIKVNATSTLPEYRDVSNISNVNFYHNYFSVNGSTCPAYVVKTYYYDNRTTSGIANDTVGVYWAKLYSNGWCEQGGRMGAGNNGHSLQSSYNVTFPIKFKNASSYTVNTTPLSHNTPTYVTNNVVDSMTINSGEACAIYWTAYGDTNLGQED